MIKILFKNSLIILLLFFSNHLLAQGLKGKVTDSAGLAIPGATVQVVGSKVGLFGWKWPLCLKISFGRSL